MKRILFILALAAPLFAGAEVDDKARSELNSIRRGLPNDDKIQTLRVRDGGSVGGNLAVGSVTVAGAATAASLSVTGATALANLTATGGATLASLNVTGALTAGSVEAADLAYGRSAVVVNVTNGQTVALTPGVFNVLAPVGGADQGTNSFLVSPMSATGVVTYVIVSTNTYAGAATTNSLAVMEDSANYSSPTAVAAPGGVLMFVQFPDGIYSK